MAYQGIGTGITPNDNNGDSLLTAALKINSNFEEIYNALGDGSTISFDQNRNVNTGDGLSGGGNLTADRTLTVDSTVLRTSGGQTIDGSLTATSFVGNGTIPVGGIIMWSGSTDSIPDGWALCNGQNSTPDLRDKFIVGAGSSYEVGNTGGENTVTLNIDQIPSHDHYVYGQDNSATATGDASDEVANVANRDSSANAIFSRTTSLSGGGLGHENRPPYYALAFIMRTA